MARLLVPAPYVVPEKKVKKKAAGTRKSAQRPEVSDSSSDESKTHSSREDEEKKRPLPLQRGKGRKGRPPQLGRPKGPRRGRPFLRTTPPKPTTAKRSGHTGPSP